MQRPSLYAYDDFILFMRDMLAYRRSTEPNFSVNKLCQTLRRCSPGLVSNILARKRRLSVDRVLDIGHILGLTTREKHFLKDWVLKGEPQNKQPIPVKNSPQISGKRRRVSSFILKHWLHPYVKDAIRLTSIQADRQAIYQELSGIASKKQIDQSLKFLQYHGYIRSTPTGKLEESEPLNVLGDEHADQKIRNFHKHALDIAKAGIEQYPIEERLAQALLLPLDAPSYAELIDLIREFSEKLQVFSEQHAEVNNRLYQLLIHLTPTGSRAP